MYINTKEMRENSFKEVWPFFLFFSFSLQLFFKATDEFALNFFSRKNLLSQTTTEQHNTNTHRTIAFRRDNIHFTRKSNQNQSCLRSTTRW